MTQVVRTAHDEYTIQMFNEASENLVTNNYKNMIDKNEFKTKLTGVAYDNRQEHIKTLTPSQELFLVHDKDNEYHQNAIKVVTEEGLDIGFLPRELSDEMIKVLNENNRQVFVEEVTGDSETEEFHGVNICIKKRVEVVEKIKNYPPSMKKDDVLMDIATQLEVVDIYEKHKETLDKVIRTKVLSLSGNDEYEKKIIIAIASLYRILKYKQSVMFLYNDKQSMMEDSRILNMIISKYKVNIQEFLPDKLGNEDFVTYMTTNEVDILLSTYTSIDKVEFDFDFGLVSHNHIEQNLRFIKVHRINQINSISTIFNHYNFRKMKQKDLEDAFGIKTFIQVQAEGFIKDLTMVDKRNIPEKELYIFNFLKESRKTIIYVNTRMNAIDLAKKLRSKLPRDLKNKIMFYHSGLHIENRKIIEEKFLNNEYLFIVATTAFDIALNKESLVDTIFIYNPPYTYNTFMNQIVQTAKYHNCTVFLIYAYSDVHENKNIISSNVVDKSDLIYVYKTLQSMLYEKIREKFGYFHCKNHQLRDKIQEVFSKKYNNARLDIILKALEEMKVIGFKKKSNDFFIEVYDIVEKSHFEDTHVYLNNLVLMNMFVEFELLLTENVQKIHKTLFNDN